MLTPEQVRRHLRQAGAAAEAAMRHGHPSRSALSVAADDETIPLRQGNLEFRRAR